MKNIEFKRLRKRKTDQQIKEEYMLGRHGKLTDRQLEIICENSVVGRGGVAFKYKPRKERLNYLWQKSNTKSRNIILK